MDIVLHRSDSHCREGLVPAAGNAFTEGIQLSVPSGTASAAESCHVQGHAPSQVGPHPMMERYKGPAISVQLGTNLKGHSNSRSLCMVSLGCHWTSITAKYLYVIKIMPPISSIFKVHLFLTQFLSLAIDIMLLYAARGC